MKPPNSEDKAWLLHFLPRAESGDPEAQIAVGWEFWRGELLDKDLQKSEFWFRKSAEKLGDMGFLNLLKMLRIERSSKIDNVIREREWTLAAVMYIYGHYKLDIGDKQAAMDAFMSGSKSGHILCRLRYHQLHIPLYIRIIMFPYEVILIVSILLKQYLSSDDPSVLR